MLERRESRSDPGGGREALARGGRALVVAEAVAFATPVAVLPWLTRSLGVTSYGRLQTVLALSAFFGLIANPGLGTVALRRSARRPSRVRSLVGRLQPLRIGSALVAAGGLACTAWLLRTSSEVLLLVLLQGVVLTVQAFSVDVYLLGIGDTAWVGYSRCASLVLYGVGILLCVRTPDHTPAVLWVTIASSAAVVVAGTLRLRALVGRSPWSPAPRSTRVLLLESLGFGAASVMSMIYGRIDVLFLRVFRGEEAVGVYSAAVRVTEGLYGVINVILGSLYPRAVTERLLHPRRADALAQRAMRLAALVVLPGAVGASVAGGPLLLWVAGPSFGGQDALVGVLGAVTVAGTAASLFTAFGLMGQGRSRAVLLAASAGAATNAGLNVIAIPLWGPMGAAATTLLAQTAVAVAAARLARPPLRVSAFRALAPWCLPSGIMAAVVLSLRAVGARAPLLLAAGVATYATSVWLGGLLTRSERRGLRLAFASKGLVPARPPGGPLNGG